MTDKIMPDATCTWYERQWLDYRGGVHCICDTYPETTNGPEEDCEIHGRPYAEWVERADKAEAELAHMKPGHAQVRVDKIEATAKEAHSVQGRGWHSEVSLERDTRGRIPAWHPDAKYIAMMDPATTLALVAELRELRAKVERVREVHRENTYPDWPVSRCYDCDDVWPCETARVLGEEA